MHFTATRLLTDSQVRYQFHNKHLSYAHLHFALRRQWIVSLDLYDKLRATHVPTYRRIAIAIFLQKLAVIIGSVNS